MSSIQRFENGFDWINFFRHSKIMCWDNLNLIEEFSKREFKKITLFTIEIKSSADILVDNHKF